MEMNDNIVRGMNDFVDFLYSLDRIKQKFPAEQVFCTKILEDVDPALVKWKGQDRSEVTVLNGVVPSIARAYRAGTRRMAGTRPRWRSARRRRTRGS